MKKSKNIDAVLLIGKMCGSISGFAFKKDQWEFSLEKIEIIIEFKKI